MKHLSRHRQYRALAGTTDDTQFYVGRNGTLYTQEVGGTLQKASSIGATPTVPPNTYGISDASYQSVVTAATDSKTGIFDKTVFDILIAREQKAAGVEAARYSTVKSTEQVAAESRDQAISQKTSVLDTYLRSGQASKDAAQMAADFAAANKVKQDALFAQNPALQSMYAFDATSGAYIPVAEPPKKSNNTLLYVIAGVAALGVGAYIVTKKDKK